MKKMINLNSIVGPILKLKTFLKPWSDSQSHSDIKIVKHYILTKKLWGNMGLSQKNNVGSEI